MGSGYFTDPLIFVVNAIAGIVVLTIAIRFLLQLFRGDFYNPISQFVVKFTNPMLKPLRRLIPGTGGVDMASVVLMLLVQVLTQTLVFLLSGASLSPVAIFFSALIELVNLFFYIFIFGILIQVILSWVSPGGYNPAISIIYCITEPVLRPCRRILPAMGGFDLSPMIAMIGLEVLRRLVIPPIAWLARSFM